MSTPSQEIATQFLVAATNQDVTTTKALLDAYGSEIVNARNAVRATALHYYARSNDVATVRMLIEAGAEIDARKDTLRTPLMLAALNDARDVIEYLLSMGANPLLTDNNIETATSIAKREGHDDTASRLREAETQWVMQKTQHILQEQNKKREKELAVFYQGITPPKSTPTLKLRPPAPKVRTP